MALREEKLSQSVVVAGPRTSRFVTVRIRAILSMKRSLLIYRRKKLFKEAGRVESHLRGKGRQNKFSHYSH